MRTESQENPQGGTLCQTIENIITWNSKKTILMMIPSGNDHALEAADPLELAEIKRRWEPYINQTPDYAYLCKDLLNGKM